MYPDYSFNDPAPFCSTMLIRVIKPNEEGTLGNFKRLLSVDDNRSCPTNFTNSSTEARKKHNTLFNYSIYSVSYQ